MKFSFQNLLVFLGYKKGKNPPRLTNAMGKYAKEFYDNIDNPKVSVEHSFKWVAIRKENINNEFKK
jgi:hypothetical protein